MCRMFGAFDDARGMPHLAAINRLLPGGPDEQNLRWGEGWVFGHTRLAINGVLNGSQPYTSFGLHCLFVGEIYNYQELAERYNLPRSPGGADGEVILPLFQLFGPSFVEHLEGMFSIAIMDVREQEELFLFTDSCAIKPVYYRTKNGAVSFASEIEGIPDLEADDRSIKASSFDRYASYRAFLGKQTIFPTVRVLEPATYLRARNGRVTIESYQPRAEDVSVNGYGFSESFLRGVNKTMITDVPMCTTLSGGLDSSLVASLAARDNRMTHAFNVWYEGDWDEDETEFAREVASNANLQYEQVIVETNRFPDLIQKMCRSLSQPNSAAHCLSTFRLYEAIAAAGFKVALVGEGADDFYGGYDRIVNVKHNQNDPNVLDAYIDDLSAIKHSLRNEIIRPEAANADHFDECSSYLKSLPGETLFRKILNFESRHRLPYYILHRVDALSMAHSVEARVPFCLPSVYAYSFGYEDDELVDNTNRKKPIYRAGNGIIPDSVMTREKQPFLLPIAGMLRPGFPVYELLMDTMSSNRLTHDIVDTNALKALIDRNIEKPSNQLGNAIWTWMIFELWGQEHDISIA